MSIRFKILFGCLSLTLITALMGGFSLRSQQDLGTIATRIYDEAFLAVSYLREAQNALMTLSVDYSRIENDAQTGTAERALLLAEAVPEILDSLQVAHDRAMSPDGERVTEALRTAIEHLQTLADAGEFDTLVADLAAVQQSFDTVVEIYAGDGYRYRQSVARNLEQSSNRTWLVMALSLVVAIAITTLLARSIVPALRQVVGIAKAIAAGRLDNRIESRDASETGQMLGALSVMQTSIASNLERINALMAQQASSHAGEMAIQHTRFEAALQNMTQGLCLFDAQGRLTIFNRRFAEMFGAPDLGAPMAALLAGKGLQPPADLGQAPSFLRDLPDGRIIAAAHQPVEGGGWVATYEDVTERRRVEARFAHMARHDALTGLPNRVRFREHMEDALARGRGKAFSVLSLDLDGFKAINDTMGHPTGDALLQAVARRLLECASEADIVARLGGDEFVVIQAESAQETDIATLAQRLVETLHAPFDLGPHPVVIGTSVGIASTRDIADPTAPSTPDTLLKNADLALHRAKADGRGTFRFFEAEMDARLQARRSLELDLQTALDKGQFEILYQPLVDTEQGCVAGFEALLRWHHPERGTVSPAEFIPVAEDTGMIRAIGAWVLERACLQAATWPEHVKIAVNLSAVQFSGNLVEIVSRALAISGLGAGRLELEITESLLLQESGGVLETLHTLRELGARIAMDDFGTGYSSLSYLQRFPFDKIKIDQGFIRRLSEQSDSAAIVRAVIGLGKSLGMAIIAEGVETAEQLAILQAEGCWDVQGYFFSPPRPAGETAGLMRRIGTSQTSEQKRVDGALTAA